MSSLSKMAIFIVDDGDSLSKMAIHPLSKMAIYPLSTVAIHPLSTVAINPLSTVAIAIVDHCRQLNDNN